SHPPSQGCSCRDYGARRPRGPDPSRLGFQAVMTDSNLQSAGGGDRARNNRGVLFELHGVTMERAGKTVLRDVTARLPKGASCVAGPSGSGKSTLLRLLNRLADPASGRVLYGG